MPVSVDLPMPGEPPSRVTEPGTNPPPSTRSSSPRPVCRRATETARTSASATGRPAAGPPPARAEPLERPRPGATARASSTSVFHSPHPGHCPIQCGASWAQDEQQKIDDERAMPPT
jgi:hypothetical protein